jgi:uncharacterized protein (TIGR02996 family)
MTTESDFLWAIVEAPDDDALRLVYSDWLEEHGRPRRAELIRVQVPLARLPARDPQRAELEGRELALLRDNERQWLGPLRPWLSGWQFRRGLVEVVSLKAATLLKHAATLFRLAPVRHAEVHRADKLGRDLAGCRYLARLTSFRLRGWRTSDSLCFLASEHLTGLTSLGLSQASLTDAGVEALAASPLLARLSDLDLSCNGLHDESALALAASPRAARLERLDLSRNHITDVGAEALATSTALTNLRSLRLSGYSWLSERGRRLLQIRFGDRAELT